MNVSPRQLVVIGGGPAGLAAAAAARHAGLDDVLLIERDDYLGGILNQCIHHGFGRDILGETLTGPEYAHIFIEQAIKAQVECWTKTMVTGLSADKCLVAYNRNGLHRIQARAIILSMGCRERTRVALGIPGSRPAGIYTAGTAQNFINLRNRMPGKNVLILGSGDIGLIMARRLSLEGANVLGVVEKLPYPGGLPRNIVQCLDEFDIPLYLGHTIVDIRGRQRLEGVTMAKLDEAGEIMPDSSIEIACDTLLLSVGLIPENELSWGAGIELDAITGGPRVDETGQTSIEGIYACGNVLYVHDIADQLTNEAQAVGRAAAHQINGGKRQRFLVEVVAGPGIKFIVPQQLSTPGKRLLNLRVDSPGRDKYIVVRCGRSVLKEQFMRRVNPPEQICFEVEVPFLSGRDTVKLELK
jgi:NADPH-dependent 2,4-dienoyl-CoA reductase/sulfur reductase-like enzyme